MKKVSLVVLLLLLLTVFLTACSQQENQVLEKDVLRIGMELKYPPFESKDEKGRPVGASVDLAKGLGQYLGKEIEIVDTPYPSLIPALISGEIDLIISSMTITEARTEKVDFSDPYTTSQLMLLVHQDSQVESDQDLNNEDVTIVSKTGTIGALWAQANAPRANIKNVEEESTAVQSFNDLLILSIIIVIHCFEI